MNNLISGKIEALKRFEKGIEINIKMVIDQEKAIIIDMNTEDQLYEQGINSAGVKLASFEPYEKYTISIKREKGQPTNRVTLRDEGDFHNSFDLDITDESFEVIATDIKRLKLTKKYGKQILGLTDKNTDELVWSYIYPALIEELKKILQ